MLFNGSNLTASANELEWNGKQWSIVNHFIPFTEAEVGAPERFESDFMVQYLSDITLSAEASAVRLAGQDYDRLTLPTPTCAVCAMNLNSTAQKLAGIKCATP
ncbi:MAG: hypothetical protein Q8J77_06980 [Methylotenera sp.]|nr:hypothetical protein [Methylotenera sp.]